MKSEMQMRRKKAKLPNGSASISEAQRYFIRSRELCLGLFAAYWFKRSDFVFNRGHFLLCNGDKRALASGCFHANRAVQRCKEGDGKMT